MSIPAIMPYPMPAAAELPENRVSWRADPDRAVAWRTRESGATWSYELEPTAAGTRLTGRRELPRFSVGTTVMAPLIGGAVGHDEELAAGIRTTLERIKGAVERD